MHGRNLGSRLWIGFLLALYSPSALGAGAGDPNKRPMAGEVVSVNGVAFIREDGSQDPKSIRPAKAGETLYAGDVVNTSSTGSVKILLKDKTVMDIGPSALMKVNEFKSAGGSDRQVDMSVAYGSIRTAVSQKLQGKGKIFIRTSIATMGVRGTEFVVNSTPPSGTELDRAILNLKSVSSSAAPAPEGARTELTVLQGQVEAHQRLSGQTQAGGPSALLGAGKQIVAREGDQKPAQVVSLSREELARISSLSRFKDRTFLRSVSFDETGEGGDSTRALISSAMASARAPDVPLDRMGFAGTFLPRDAAMGAGPGINYLPGIH